MQIEDWLGKENTFGLDIWKKKYQSSPGETFEIWLDRVSGNNEEMRDLILNKRFLFGGRILANRGLKGIKSTLSNCYCLPVDDNLEAIFKCASEMARTYSYGGGVGINLSHLCPAGMRVNNAAKTSSGALSYADLFNLTTSLIGQAGRRGALMLALSSEHPEIEEFIDLKNDLTRLTHANLSVMISDKFMENVEQNKLHSLYFKRVTGSWERKEVFAKTVFNKLVENNWRFAEPGMLFWDRIKNWSLVSEDPEFILEGVNPCSELPLPAYGACNLGSFNLVQYLRWNEKLNTWEFNFGQFRLDISKVVRAMDEIIDEGLLLHPLIQQQEVVAKYRQLGIGIFGLADVFIKLGIRYGNEESILLSKNIAETLINQAVSESALLAKEKGSYPGYNAEAVQKSKFFNNLFHVTRKYVKEFGLRNATLISIAPTGSISNLVGSGGGGIEPIYSISYNRTTESLHGESRTYKMYTPVIEELMKKFLISEKNLPDYVVTSKDIRPLDRVKMQAAWQEFVDSSISSTVNLPYSATEKDIADIYMNAWKMGLKGITIYRKGCEREGILTEDEPIVIPDYDGIEKATIEGLPVMMSKQLKVPFDLEILRKELKRGSWKPIAEDTEYKKIKLNTGCAKLVLFAGWSKSENCLQEVWVKKRGRGGCSSSIDSIVIQMSAILRLGGNLDNVAKAFDGVDMCKAFVRAKCDPDFKISKGISCADAILKALENLEVQMKVKNLIPIPKASVFKEFIKQFNNANTCPECSHALNYSGGCNFCSNCGYTKCE